MADTKENLICPACKKQMKKIFIEEHNFYVDVCLDGCGGIFFDNRELEHFDEEHEPVDAILNLVEGREFLRVDTELKRICPNCNSVMIKNGVQGCDELIIDHCYACGAKFLDNGELQKLRQICGNEQERAKEFNKAFFAMYAEELKTAEAEQRQAEANRKARIFKWAILILAFAIAIISSLKKLS